MAKAPIYTSDKAVADNELFQQLCDAIERLRWSMIPSSMITKSGESMGYGVKKAQRSIAADEVIAITRQIKARPGW